MKRPAPEDFLLERRRERIDAVVAARSSALTLVLENVHDPHNLAAALRTAEGLGVQSVQVVEAARGFRPSPKVAQGADKWLDVHRHRDAGACADALAATGHRLFGSRLEGPSVDVEQLPFTGKIALAFGNEHDGLSGPLAARCAGFFRIPMFGFAQSFNVSVAVGITLAVAVLARRRAGLGGDLTEPERAALRQRFYARAMKQGGRLR